MSFDPRNPDFEAAIREGFSKQAMMRSLQAEITSLAPGRVEIAAPLLPDFTQQFGFAHAGCTFALGDTAAGYAAMSLMPPDHDVISAELKIHLLNPGRGTRLVARGEVIKPGRRLFVVRADVFAEAQGGATQIATLLGTMVPVPL